jgi:hypothetical protein
MPQEKIAFVLMGYGTKVDFATGRSLNLDKTYENIIKPVFKKLGIKCFRASDIQHSGTIDVPMYKFIQKADIVIADISTLNPNAIYELGVRHALRPQTTIVIAEQELQYPFDLSHTTILPYEHLGSDIGFSEAKRFKKKLKRLIEAVSADPQTDSPVYTNIPNLQPPGFTKEEIKELEEASEETETVAKLIVSAMTAISETDYEQAKRQLHSALDFSPNDTFTRQQLALATYKAGTPTLLDALAEAEQILAPLYPERTNDTETLGLLGAIYKRRHLSTNNISDLLKSIEFYGRGFVVARDYYNGVNLGLQLLKQAIIQADLRDAVTDITLAQRVYDRTESYCLALMAENFEERPDRRWIVQTLAEVKYAQGNQVEFRELMKRAHALGEGKFEEESFLQQMAQLDPTLRESNRILGEYNNIFSKWRT